MKIRIEVDEHLDEEYVVIHCRKLDTNILRMQEMLSAQQLDSNVIILHRGENYET